MYHTASSRYGTETKDINAPIEAIRYLAEKLPNATLKEFKEDTHYTMGDHLEEAVTELMITDGKKSKFKEN